MPKKLSSNSSLKNTASLSSHILSEKETKLSELKYRRLFEAAQDGILILDAYSGEITDANPFIESLLGYSHSELIGKELWEIGVFKDIFDSKKAFQKLQIKEYIRYKDLPLRTKNGTSIAVEFVSNVYKVGDQKVIQCNIRDITDRKAVEKMIKDRSLELEKKTQAEAKSNEALLNVMEDLKAANDQIELEKAKDEAMLTSIGEGLIAVNKKGIVTIMNQVAADMLGWKIKELMGRKLTDLCLEDEAGNLISLAKRPTTLALTTGKATKDKYYFVKKDKTRLPIAITATPIKFAGKTIGLIEIVRDITRENEIDKAKSEFVSLASHQLRSPLGIIKWYLETIRNEDHFIGAPQKMKDYFNEIYKSNERVLSLVRNLLSVSRIDQGRVKNTPQPTDPVQIIKEIIKQMQIKASKRNISLNLSVTGEKISVIDIDKLRFQEVMENLIGNAIEYSYPSGAVDITCKKQKDVIEISVKDRGIGISEADQKKIFIKFFRSAKAAEYNPSGSGLGLYVAKSYVEAWGGKISVQSKKGKGSIFTISLPVHIKN